jgi:CubicO group peptidase (beta-lactamase class C family)|tara:strand:+ start:308 stop:1582 length:1275 start_codon:yes stop_codon:yes gene_type:complete
MEGMDLVRTWFYTSCIFTASNEEELLMIAKKLVNGLFSTVSTCLLFSVSLGYAQAPFIDPADDEKHFGPSDNILFWTPEQQVAGYRNSEKISDTRRVSSGNGVLSLPYARVDLSDVLIQVENVSMTVDEYFMEQSVAGLLVIKDGDILYERYGLGNTEDSKWISFSVSKSLVSMLMGAAIQDGYIESVDEKITDYLPRLKGSSYDQSSIKNVLQMSSGVAWNEDYADPQSDVARVSWGTTELYEYLRHKPRDNAPGDVFNYNTAETNLAGTLLRAAIGNNLSTYLTEKIWKPFGMESDAVWNLTEAGGGEFGGCCINAILRDYGRIGLFALGDGRLADGTEVLAPGWMQESTRPSKGFSGYGYFWWLTAQDIFRATGVFGQGIYINREANVVIAIHSARGDASKDSDWALQEALYAAITVAIKD